MLYFPQNHANPNGDNLTLCVGYSRHVRSGIIAAQLTVDLLKSP